MSLDNSVLRYRNGIDEGAEEPDLSLTLSRDVLNRVLLQQTSLGAEIEAGNVSTEGDVQVLGQLFSLLDNFTPTFPIATSAVPAGEDGEK